MDLRGLGSSECQMFLNLCSLYIAPLHYGTPIICPRYPAFFIPLPLGFLHSSLIGVRREAETPNLGISTIQILAVAVMNGIPRAIPAAVRPPRRGSCKCGIENNGCALY